MRTVVAKARILTVLLVFSPLLAGGMAVATSSQPAFAKCTIYRTNDFVTERFAGWLRSGGGVTPGGVYAEIYNYSPWVSSPSDDTTSAWTMLDNGPYWAQVGWIEFPGSLRRTFYQVASPNGFYNNMSLSAYPVGSYIYYTTDYNPANGNFTMFANNGLVFQVAAGFVPTEAEILGETHTLASQMPGDLYSGQGEEGFFDSSIYLGGAWQAFSGYTVHTDGYEATDGPYSSGHLLYIYDTDC